jgi:hypothetical protein
MTTREEYAEAATSCKEIAAVQPLPAWKKERDALLLAARVLRALADGAVLCHEEDGKVLTEGGWLTWYAPIEERP